jgi:hypothetical protein
MIQIYKEKRYITYVGDTSITLVFIEKSYFSHLIIESVNVDNENRLIIDNLSYLKAIDENKRELKTSLQGKSLWEKGVVQAIKLLLKKLK